MHYQHLITNKSKKKKKTLNDFVSFHYRLMSFENFLRLGLTSSSRCGGILLQNMFYVYFTSKLVKCRRNKMYVIKRKKCRRVFLLGSCVLGFIVSYPGDP